MNLQDLERHTKPLNNVYIVNQGQVTTFALVQQEQLIKFIKLFQEDVRTMASVGGRVYTCGRINHLGEAWFFYVADIKEKPATIVYFY